MVLEGPTPAEQGGVLSVGNARHRVPVHEAAGYAEVLQVFFWNNIYRHSFNDLAGFKPPLSEYPEAM
jgi:hypothetical protein